MKKMEFMLDQGGTFTDIIAIRPDGKIITKKFFLVKAPLSTILLNTV